MGGMLVGRNTEQRAIAALLDRARGGESGVLALVGEAGIGKSTLVEWAASKAGGMAVLRARGVQSEAHIPFAGLFELLRPALGSIDQLPAPQAAALEGALALRAADAGDRLGVGAATLTLLAAYAEREPLAVLIDDAHWLDGSTADALRFALRRLLADPVAVILTAREGEPSLLDGTDLPVHRLEGLDVEATAALLRERAPAAEAERLYRETGGNPLALVELARQAVAGAPVAAPMPLPVPASLSAAYVARAESLPEPAQRVLVLAAASDRCETDVLGRAAAALGLDLDDLAAAEDAGLVERRADRITWSHPLARSAIYGHAGPAQQRDAHRALARALPDVDLDRRAWHLALGATGVDEPASSGLEQAARRAERRSAYDVASHAYERAALLAPDADRRATLLVSAAESAWLAGAAGRVGPLLDEASAFPGDDELRIRADALRGDVAANRGPIDEGRALLAEAAELAAPHAPEQAVVMLAGAALACFWSADVTRFQEHAARAGEMAAGTGDGRTRFFADLIAGMAAIFVGEGDRGAELVRSAVELLERSDALRDEPRLLWWAAMGPLWLREAGTGDGLVERAERAARTNAAVGVLPHLLLYIGIYEAAGDRWAQARATFDEAIHLARELGLTTPMTACLARLAIIEARGGHEAPARAHAEEALELARASGTHLLAIWALSALGELESARGDVGAALRAYDELAEMMERHGIADADVSPAPEQVELHLRAGDRDHAVAAAGPFQGRAAVKGQPWALARAARCEALLADDGRLDEAFGEALGLHARTQDAFETARTQLAYGSRLRRAGQRQRSREQLRAALATFDRLGARPWADRAQQELRATGETARRRDPSTLDELTAQELRVALLLAGGRTTRETAAELFLSPKTVEYHQRNAYRKLGVRSREELAAALSDGDAPDGRQPSA